MNSDRLKQIEDLYHSALERKPEERPEFLKKACSGDEPLREEVESLLRHEKQSGFTEKPGLATAFAASSDKDEPIAAGTRLGPYRIVSMLGKGGMGEVYRATDTRLDRTVAIKVLPAHLAGDPERRDRFEREARAVSSLNHPHICTLHDVGEQDGIHFLVMEYVDGQALSTRLEEGPLAPDLLIRFGSQTAHALAAAHERGIIHRDLKPANLMVTGHGIKVLDFGLAKFADLDSAATGVELTSAGQVLGTPAYMSPEQIRGEELDARSDVFSLGCVLYEAATGRRAFRGSTVYEIVREVVDRHPDPPSGVRPDLPAGLDLILARAMAKDRSQRHESAQELAHDLDALTGASVPAKPRLAERQPDPVFGRERELVKLEGVLTQVLNGSGKFVLLTGESGIGKTALAGNFVYSARQAHADLLLGRGACEEQYGTSEPYLPFLEAVGGLLHGDGRERVRAILMKHAPTWCLQFPAVFSSQSLESLQRETIGATKERMLRELSDALGELAATSALVLYLEDLHWADAASVDLLRHLGERARTQRLLLLGTARPEEVDRGNQPLKNCKRELESHGACEEIALAALAPDHVEAYLQTHFSPNSFPVELAPLIHRKTEGHPLFATGAIQLLAERGHLARTNGGWALGLPLAELDLDVPASVRSMIEKKLEILDEDAHRLLQYASIEGEEFTSTVVAALLETDELDIEERLDHLERLHHLLRTLGEEELPDGSLTTKYRFAHALYQNFLYDQLLSKRRALLHRKAGETLEAAHSGQTAQIATVLATHFERGRDFQRASQYFTQAGDNALQRYANAEAVGYYDHGMELTRKLSPEDGRRVRLILHQKLGSAHHALGQLDRSEAHHKSILDQARADGDATAECVALNLLAKGLTFTDRIDEMEVYGNEAMRIAQQTGNQAQQAEALASLASVNQFRGNVLKAAEVYDEAISLARSTDQRPALLRALTFRTANHNFRTEYASAETHGIEATGLASQLRDGFLLSTSSFLLGLSLTNQGRLSEGLGAFKKGLAAARRNRNAMVAARVLNCIGWIHRELLDVQQGIEHDQTAVELAREAKAWEAEANAAINLVYGYTLTGERDRALEAMKSVDELYAGTTWIRWRFYDIRERAAVADFWLAQRKLDRAEENACALLQNARQQGVPKYIAVAHRLLGEIAAVNGDPDAAEEELMKSLEPFGTHPAPLVEWRNHAALGRLLAARGRPAAARQAFSQAAEIIETLAANLNEPALKSVYLKSDLVREIQAGARE